MKFLLLALGPLLSGLAAAVPAKGKPDPVDTWTMTDLQMERLENATRCQWTFIIAEKSQAGTDFSCRFDVQTDAGVDCGTAPWLGLMCTNSDAYVVNGGHYSGGHYNGGADSTGFYVIVMTNMPENAGAYFGASDLALNQSSTAPVPMQMSLAYPSSSFGKKSRDMEHMIAARDDQTMTVKNVRRDLNSSTSTIYMELSIVDGTVMENGAPKEIPCSFWVSAPNGTNLETYGFPRQDCSDSAYSVAWGYQADKDAAVMAVVIPEKNQLAYFGWDWVNRYFLDGRSTLSNVGPNRVFSCPNNMC